MPELQRLRADHAAAVLAFELANRAYFAASVSDRADEFYTQFTERHNALMAEQKAGTGAFYVLVADDASVLGRFNLYRLHDGTAELGYRVAERVAGRGVATAAVKSDVEAACRSSPASSAAGIRLTTTAGGRTSGAVVEVISGVNLVLYGKASAKLLDLYESLEQLQRFLWRIALSSRMRSWVNLHK